MSRRKGGRFWWTSNCLGCRNLFFSLKKNTRGRFGCAVMPSQTLSLSFAQATRSDELLPYPCFFMVASSCCRTSHHICIPGRKMGQKQGTVLTTSISYYRKALTFSETSPAHKASLARLSPMPPLQPRGKLGYRRRGLPQLP